MSKVEVILGGHTFEIEVNLNLRASDELPVTVNGDALRVTVPDLDAPIDQMEWIIVDDHPREIVIDADLRWVRDHTGVHFLDVRDLDTHVTRPTSRDGRIKAPIPGQIKVVLVAEGDRVEAGQPLFILEAMKMENEITAPCGGIVAEILVAEGKPVSNGDILFIIK